MNKQSHYDKMDEKEQPFKPRNYIKSTAGAVPIRNEKGDQEREICSDDPSVAFSK